MRPHAQQALCRAGHRAARGQLVLVLSDAGTAAAVRAGGPVLAAQDSVTVMPRPHRIEPERPSPAG